MARGIAVKTLAIAIVARQYCSSGMNGYAGSDIGNQWTALPAASLLFDDDNRRLPERGLLPGRIEHRHLAIVFAGRELIERKIESQRHGLQAIIQRLRSPSAAEFRKPSVGPR